MFGSPQKIITRWGKDAGTQVGMPEDAYHQAVLQKVRKKSWISDKTAHQNECTK